MVSSIIPAFDKASYSDSSENTSESSVKSTKRRTTSNKKKGKTCRNCLETFTNIEDFWQHSRIHIREDKLIACPVCPFVTEYKHHYTYHMGHHTGNKPFKCDQCTYECISKSMLISHQKSHSDLCQYRCADCDYKGKFARLLKIHARRTGHTPGQVLKPDGTPDETKVVEVYGRKRLRKSSVGKSHEVKAEPYVPPPKAKCLDDSIDDLPDPFVCDFCCLELYVDYDKHMAYHNKDDPMSCNECGVRYLYGLEFFIHLELKHKK